MCLAPLARTLELGQQLHPHAANNNDEHLYALTAANLDAHDA